MGKEHHYRMKTVWTGNRGTGTSGYREYGREHELSGEAKSISIPGSSDPKFRGDAARYNPEELFVGSISTCHMLWVLHLCADKGIVVTSYEDEASGVMVESADGGGEVTVVTLRPKPQLANADRAAELDEIHHRAHELCFISRSVKTDVRVEPSVV
ncbi:MAG TPA: OsmC family protein [Bryobacteraceae bacterium]|nr:OsmC family protein [Bryobacteraceae bacterium]